MPQKRRDKRFTSSASTDQRSAIKREAEQLITDALQTRKSLKKEKIVALIVTGGGTAGDHFFNFEKTIKNRMIDLFDDCHLLLKSKRTPSACILARSIIETYATGIYFFDEVMKTFQKDGISAANQEITRFTNSSNIKVISQKKFKSGFYDDKDYFITEQARRRMENEEAQVIHVNKALNYIFNGEKEISKTKESSLEACYISLCEWNHPSQMSLFNTYSEGAEKSWTSVGELTIFDLGFMQCAMALNLVTKLPQIFIHIASAAETLSKADNAPPLAVTIMHALTNALEKN